MGPKFSKGFRKMASNSGYLIFEKVLNLGVAFIVSIYVTRYLGVEDFGLLEYSISAVALFLPLGRMGTTHLAIRDLVGADPKSQKKIMGTVFNMLLTTSFIVAFLTIFIFWQIESDARVRILVVIASFSFLLQAFDVFDYWFQANVLSKYSVIARIGFQLGSSLAKVAFIYLGLSVTFFGFSVVIGGVVQIVGLYYFYRKLNNSIKWTFSRDYAKSLVKKSWPLLISGISLAIYMRIDILMLKNMVDAKAVGNYSVAVKLSELWYFIPMALISSLFPSIIKVRKESTLKYNNRMRYLYEVLILLALVIAIPMTLLSKSLVLLLYGEEFIASSTVLSIHIWAGIFVFMALPGRNGWLMKTFSFME